MAYVFLFLFYRDPANPPQQALCALQVSDTVLYLVAAVVIYRYTGADVTSPALSASTKILEKIAYGVAIPTIVIAGVINGHVAAVSATHTHRYM